jgi:hypothetical protein
VKEQRLALELASATRERDFYLKQVDQGKAIDAMAAKQQRRAQQAAEAGAAPGGEAQEPPRAKAGGARVVRTFQQVRESGCLYCDDATYTRWCAEACARCARGAAAVAERAGAGVWLAARGRGGRRRGRRATASQEAEAAAGVTHALCSARITR